MQKQNLERQLLIELSKSNINTIVCAINNEPTNFSMLWEITKKSDPPLPSRASWAMTHCCDQKPDLFFPYIDESIDLLRITKDYSVLRNLLRILSIMPINEEKMGELFDISLSFFESNAPPSVRVHSMQILYNISKIEEELQPELIAIIENSIQEGSKGLKSRGNKLLNKLKSQQKNMGSCSNK